MQKTLYISDLDGTLLNPSAQLSENSINIINNIIRAGGLFTYATARSFSSASPITAPLRLNLPLATYNGAFFVEPDSGKFLAKAEFKCEHTTQLLQQLKESGIFPLAYSVIDGLERVSYISDYISPGAKAYVHSRMGDRRLRPVSNFAELHEGEIFYFTIIGEKEELWPLVQAVASNPDINHNFQMDTYSSDYWLEIYPCEASKQRAVQWLKQYTGADRVVCFGDNINDIPMFQAADEGYAVENACDELKAVATGIIPANTEDGVARWLEENL